jgi:mitotic spindle assembly checkpoint protein MAD2B
VSAVHDLLLKNTPKRVVVVIYSKEGKVMERYLFDVERFPFVEKGSAWVEFEDGNGDVGEKGNEETEGSGDELKINIVDIEEQLRATICKLDYEGSKKSPLPEGCRYTLAVELRDDPLVMPPIRVAILSYPSPRSTRPDTFSSTHNPGSPP